MPIEKRLFAKGIDRDTELRMVDNGKYRDGLNIRINNSATGNVFAVENLKGNTLVSVTLSGGVNEFKGGYDDKVGKRLFYFVWNSENDHKLIQYKYDTKEVTTVIDSSVLNLQRDKLITSVVLVDNRFLAWTDNFNEPSIVDLDDVSKYSTISERALIELMKAPSFTPLTVSYQTDTNYDQNNLRDAMYKFRTRYKYKDGTYSHSSVISKTPLPKKYGADVYKNESSMYNDNVISITVPSPTSDDVEKIQIIGQSGNSDEAMSDWFLIQELDYSSSDQTIYFKNDKIYQSLNQNEINLIQSFVPQKCQALEYVSSNRLVFANITEGFNVNNITPDVALIPQYEIQPTIPTSTINASYSDSNTPSSLVATNITYGITIGDGTSGSSLLDTISFSGTISAGDTFNITLRLSYNISGATSTRDITFSVTAISPVLQSFVQAFADEINATDTRTLSGQYGGIVAVRDSATTIKIYQGGNQEGTLPPSDEVTLASFVSSSAEIPSLGSLPPVASFKRFKTHTFGIMYMDDKGRKSSVIEVGDVYIDGFDGTPSNLGKTNILFRVNHEAPSWATRYSIMYVKDTYDFVQFIAEAKDNPAGAPSTGLWRFDLPDKITEYRAENENSVIAYTFQDGDLIRIMGEFTGSSPATPSYLSDIPTIPVTIGGANYLYVSEDNIPASIADGDNVLIEVVRPNKQLTDKLYYEIGEIYEIEHRDITDSRVPVTSFHKGEVQDQGFPLEIDFSAGAGTGAIAVPNITGGSGSVGGFTIFNGGSGYTSSFPVTIEKLNTSIAGSGFTGTANVTNGEVTSITLTAAGSGYPDTYSFATNEFIIFPNRIDLDDTGDVYYKYRIFDEAATNAAFIEDKNFSDFFASEVTDIGRANVVNVDSQEITRPTTVYFSQQYIPETNVNGLGFVFGTSFAQYDVQYNAIQRIRQRKKDLILYQKDRIGIIPLFSEIVKSETGSIQSNTSELLNNVQYYNEEFGLSNPESLDWYASSDYGVDTKRGVVWRLGGNGLEPIQKYGFNTYILDKFEQAEELVLSDDDIKSAKIWGVYNKRYDEYVMTIDNSWSAEITNTSPTPGGATLYEFSIDDKYTEEYGYDLSIGDDVTLEYTNAEGNLTHFNTQIITLKESLLGRRTVVGFGLNFEVGEVPVRLIFPRRNTVIFSEDNNAWVSRASFEGEGLNEFGIGMVSWKDGKLYTHDTNETRNNFYGTQYSSEVEIPFNQEPSSPKIFRNIQVESNKKWIADTNGDIYTLEGQQSALRSSDFKKRQNQYFSYILRDVNTPNKTYPLLNGNKLRSVLLVTKLTNSDTEEVKLFSVGIGYILQNLSNYNG